MEVSLPPGVVKSQSGATAMGRYVDSDHVRFVAGRPEKIPGWRKYFPTQLDGVPRGLRAFLGPEGTELVAAGTECFLYIVETALLDVDDITPIRASSTINNNPFATTDTLFVVTVTDTAHGATLDATVVFSGAAAVGGITISGSYQIASIIDDNSYTIVHSIAATSTVAAGGGAAVVAAYRINCGTISGAVALGYGVGPYGAETYGTERAASGLSLDFAYWSLDHWGDNLLAARLSEGRVYLYDDAIDTTAQVITNAPSDVLFAFVTGERYITVLREGMVVSWPDRDDPTDWTPSAVNTANSRTLVGGSKLIAGVRLARFQSLIWSDKALFVHEYTGSAFIYDTAPVGTDCGLAGPAAFCTADGAAFWMSHSGFHMFAGGAVTAIPNSEDIASYVLDNMNEHQHVKTLATYFAQARVVRFTYAHGASDEPNRYVEVSIDDWWWAPGTSERVGSTLQVAASAHPLMASFEGYVYEHELADDVNDDGAALAWHIESGLFRLEGATHALDIFGWAPDYERITGTHTLTITGKDRPQSSDLDTDTDSIDSTTEMADLRVAGRYTKFRLEQNEINGDFRLGTPIIDTSQGGARR